MPKGILKNKTIYGPVTLEKPDRDKYTLKVGSREWEEDQRGLKPSWQSICYSNYESALQRYNDHIASLQSYVAIGFEGVRDGEVEYELKEQWLLSYGQGAAWHNADDYRQHEYGENLHVQDKRFVAIPDIVKYNTMPNKVICKNCGNDRSNHSVAGDHCPNYDPYLGAKFQGQTGPYLSTRFEPTPAIPSQPAAAGETAEQLYRISTDVKSMGIDRVIIATLHYYEEQTAYLIPATHPSPGTGEEIGRKEATPCDVHGHVMYPVYSLNNFHNNGRSAFGRNKCSICGHEEDWQYDF